MKEAIKKYGLRGKGYSFRDNTLLKSMKAVHILAATAWGGGAFSMQALGFLQRSLPPGQTADLVAYCSHFVDTWIVMPGLSGCIITGLFYSCFTSIGFFKFAWIGYKWLIACSAGFWGTLFWGPWGAKLISCLEPYDLAWTLRLVRMFIVPENVWGVFLQTGIVLSVCLISVYRPVTFRFWQHHSENYEIRRRAASAREVDRVFSTPSPLDNPQVQALYDSWLGDPIGPQAKAHLHGKLKDKSARLKKLEIAGLYPHDRKIH